MRLSTKGRYSVTAMMDLAIHDKAGPVTLADISQCQGITGINNGELQMFAYTLEGNIRSRYIVGQENRVYIAGCVISIQNPIVP